MSTLYPAITESLTLGDLLSGFDRQILWLIERGYLDDLKVEKDTFTAEKVSSNFSGSFHGFQLQRLHTYTDRDRDLAAQNIENWLGLFRDGSHSFLMNIDGTGGKVPEMSFMAGQRKGHDAVSSAAFSKFLSHGMKASFPGSDRTPLEKGYFMNLQNKLHEAPYAGVITGIPSRKKPDEHFFVQGIERFLDSVSGLDFDVLLVAEPFSTPEVGEFIHPVLDLKNSTGQLLKSTLTDSKSISDALSKTISIGSGTSFASSVAKTLGAAAGLSIPINCLMASISAFYSVTKGTTSGTSTNIGAALTQTRMLSKSQSVAREAVNYSAEYALELLDLHLERLKAARNYGFWNTALYITAETPEAFLAVQNAAIACFSGESTHLEPLRFVTLKDPNQNHSLNEGGKLALTHATVGHNCNLAMFDGINAALDIKQHPLGAQMQGIGTPLTTAELGIFCAPPQRECRSISVTERAVFGGKSLASDSDKDEARLKLGEILYFGEPTAESLSVPLNGLSRHILVTGITGSGKTNTVQGICRQLDSHSVPWMVIEPGSKSEYCDLGTKEPPHVFRLGGGLQNGPSVPFRFNPFYFPRGVEVLGHIDRVKTAFNAAFPMYASMPYLLEEAIVRCYEDAGWNLSSSQNSKASDPSDPWKDPHHGMLFPTLGELLPKIDEVVASKRYDIRLEMDLSAALRARISSLLMGAKGEMLNTRHSLDIGSLLSHRVVLEMAPMGNDEEKVLMMGFLIGSLFEAAQVAGLSKDGKLRHVLVIEEAHRLLRAAPPGDNPEIANVRGGAVEQFANLLSEMRAFGHGVIVVDQSPCRLLPDVVRSTHLKIIHQLSAEEDRIAVGSAMALDASQTRDLARLRRDRGEAVVFQPEWPQAYCISVEKGAGECPPAELPSDEKRQSATRKAFPAVSEATKSHNGSDKSIDAYRALCGLLLGNEALLKKGLKVGIGKTLAADRVLGIKGSSKDTIPSAIDGRFEDFLATLLRVSPAGLDVLGDLPENLSAALIAEGDGRIERVLKIGKALREKISDEKVLLGALVSIYLQSRGFNSFEACSFRGRIIKEHLPGDSRCKEFRKFARSHADEITTGVILENHQRILLERLLIEQTLRLTPESRILQVVERCMTMP